MHGNVLEWCNDLIGEYPSGAIINPQGPATQTPDSNGHIWRVLRGGGSRSFIPSLLRSAYRSSFIQDRPYRMSEELGFRLSLKKVQ